METSAMVVEILRLPAEFRRRGDVTFGELLRATGYFNMHSTVSARDIRDALANHAERIDDWSKWSEDKRSSSGWYFDPSNCEVGFFDPNSDETVADRHLFDDALSACAEFIKLEIEEYRRLETKP